MMDNLRENKPDTLHVLQEVTSIVRIQPKQKDPEVLAIDAALQLAEYYNVLNEKYNDLQQISSEDETTKDLANKAIQKIEALCSQFRASISTSTEVDSSKTEIGEMNLQELEAYQKSHEITPEISGQIKKQRLKIFKEHALKEKSHSKLLKNLNVQDFIGLNTNLSLLREQTSLGIDQIILVRVIAITETIFTEVLSATHDTQDREKLLQCYANIRSIKEKI